MSLSPLPLPPSEKEIADKYREELAVLKVNSLAIIASLTNMAEEYVDYAHAVVRTIEEHLTQVST